MTFYDLFHPFIHLFLWSVAFSLTLVFFVLYVCLYRFVLLFSANCKKSPNILYQKITHCISDPDISLSFEALLLGLQSLWYSNEALWPVLCPVVFHVYTSSIWPPCPVLWRWNEITCILLEEDIDAILQWLSIIIIIFINKEHRNNCSKKKVTLTKINKMHRAPE